VATWASWLPDVLPHVPGCPVVVAEHELRRASQEFFRRTRAWRVNLTTIAVPASTAEISCEPADAAHDLVRVEAVLYDGRQLDPETVENLDKGFSDEWAAHVGTPTHYVQLTPGILRLYPVPSDAATFGVKIRASVTPSESATGIPDDLAQKYRDAIQAGAKSRLMLMPGKGWTNLDLAAIYGRSFSDMADSANADAARAFGAAKIATRQVWF
jgi:hypothetical protein